MVTAYDCAKVELGDDTLRVVLRGLCERVEECGRPDLVAADPVLAGWFTAAREKERLRREREEAERARRETLRRQQLVSERNGILKRLAALDAELGPRPPEGKV